MKNLKSDYESIVFFKLFTFFPFPPKSQLTNTPPTFFHFLMLGNWLLLQQIGFDQESRLPPFRLKPNRLDRGGVILGKYTVKNKTLHAQFLSISLIIILITYIIKIEDYHINYKTYITDKNLYVTKLGQGIIEISLNMECRADEDNKS